MAHRGRGSGSGSGRGGHRDNHTRIQHPGNGGGAGKHRTDEDFKREIIEGVVARMSEIMGPAMRLFPGIQDQLQAGMPVNAVGLMPRFMGLKDDEAYTYFGSKGLPEVEIEFSDGGKLARLRLGDSPFAKLSWVLKHMEMLGEKNMAPSVPHDLSHASWAENIEVFKTRAVWMRIPVSLVRRFDENDEVGEIHGHSFMCFRVIPDAWVITQPAEVAWEFTYGSTWFQTLNKSWRASLRLFNQKNGGEKIPPHDRFKLFTFPYSEDGDPKDTPTPDTESDMRFPNEKSTIPLLNIQINELSYEEVVSSEESSETENWEDLVDEEENPSEDSFQEAMVHAITEKVKQGLGVSNVNILAPPQVDRQDGGLHGPKIPILSEDSVRRLRAMEDWYNGPMEETVIANRYKDWLYLQSRALKMANDSIANKSTKPPKATQATGLMQPSGAQMPVENICSDNGVTPHYFSESPTPAVPDIDQNQGNSGDEGSSNEEEEPSSEFTGVRPLASNGGGVNHMSLPPYPVPKSEGLGGVPYPYGYPLINGLVPGGFNPFYVPPPYVPPVMYPHSKGYGGQGGVGPNGPSRHNPTGFGGQGGVGPNGPNRHLNPTFSGSTGPAGSGGKGGAPPLTRSPSLIPSEVGVERVTERSITPSGTLKKLWYSTHEWGCGDEWEEILRDSSAIYDPQTDDVNTVHMMTEKIAKDNQGRVFSIGKGLIRAIASSVPIVSPEVVSPFKKYDAGKKGGNSSYTGQPASSPIMGRLVNVDQWLATIRETVVALYPERKGKFITHTQGIVLVCILKNSGFKDINNPLKQFLDLLLKPASRSADPLLFNYVVGATVGFCSNPAAGQSTLISIMTGYQSLKQDWRTYSETMLEYGAAIGIGKEQGNLSPSSFTRALLEGAVRGNGINQIHYEVKSTSELSFDDRNSIDSLRALCAQDWADRIRNFGEDGAPENWASAELKRVYAAKHGCASAVSAEKPVQQYKNKPKSEGKTPEVKNYEKCSNCNRFHRGECWGKDPPAKDTSSQAPSNGASGAKSGTQAPSNGASGAKPGKDNAGYKPANNGQGSASGNGSSNNNGGRPSGRRF